MILRLLALAFLIWLTPAPVRAASLPALEHHLDGPALSAAPASAAPAPVQLGGVQLLAPASPRALVSLHAVGMVAARRPAPLRELCGHYPSGPAPPPSR